MLRPLLFSVAYRMLGSASDAEDVLQDAWLHYAGAKWVRARLPGAGRPRPYLDQLKSARPAASGMSVVAAGVRVLRTIRWPRWSAGSC